MSPRALPSPRWPARIERLAERVNPILVKEVRQALRGKYFSTVFSLLLVGTTLYGLNVVMSSEHRVNPGLSLFMASYAFLVFALHGLVPFSAFLAMSSERAEDTYEQLLLTGLDLRRIARGKLLYAAALALLLCSACAPSLVFAFLLGGIALSVILVLLTLSLVLSLALSAAAIAAASRAKTGTERVAGMAGLAVVLVIVSLLSISGVLLMLGGVAGVGVFLVATAALVLVIYHPGVPAPEIRRR